MPDETILCWTWPATLSSLLNTGERERSVTVKDCNTWLNEGDAGKPKLAAFFEQRMRERYFEPVEKPDEKNGFSIMALSCLMIETLECFHRGWDKTPRRKGQGIFCGFFNRDPHFDVFIGHACGFYEHIRCGILHQGETTGGWTIRRKGDLLFDPNNLRVNATKFHDCLSLSLSDYAKALQADNSQIWRNFRTKLGHIIRNCDRQP